MSNETTAPNMQVEIVSPPCVKDMTVSQVDQNMFSINLSMIAVVRFVSSDAPVYTPLVLAASATSSTSKTDLEQQKYADGTTPQPGGETAAFGDFTTQHGYPPQSREILAEWVKLQQGGA